jgi:hypothetical protein
VFRQKTKSKCLTDIKIVTGMPAAIMNYYIHCFHYIHQNPFRAKLVTNMEDWEFSSFKDYCGLREGTLCNKEMAEKFCGYTPENFIQKSIELIPEDIINCFR